MIRIQGLHKYFNQGKQNEIHVINDISLDLPEKGMVAIFGKSGCGKTTLLNVIGGLDTFASGTLTIENQSICENTDGIRNQYIGYIFQNYNLQKTESCFDNVADALRLCGMTDEKEIETRVMAALAGVEMEKYAKRTPDTLSGGQQQRIAIARAIVKNPHIVLADEPTGNLDEANTVMIMDLLKAIAKDHLVLLVTHEANLVDHYCDTVIELQDGRVIGTRRNASADGYTTRDKNDIFLGELQKHEICDENAKIEYYGAPPENPIKLKIVNHSDRIYVQIGTKKVQVLDESSEIRLHEGVFRGKEQKNKADVGFDTSSLPPVHGTRFGRLFTLKSAIKSGYACSFRHSKRRRRGLRTCLGLFSAVIVLMSAIFGSAFGDLTTARNAYNHNVFYVNASAGALSARLTEAVGAADTGIDFVRLMTAYPKEDEEIRFFTGSFETFHTYDYESSFKTNASYLDRSLSKNLTLAEGKKDGLTDTDILISTKVADALLEKSALGYITERKDLLGLVCGTFQIDGQYPRIAGIVETDEPAIYLSEIGMAKYVYSAGAVISHTKLASEYGIKTRAGEAILVLRYPNEETEYPAAGDTVKIQGRDVRITAVRIAYADYAPWMEANGLSPMKAEDFFSSIVRKENPTVEEGSDAFVDLLNTTFNSRYYEYFDYYYSHIDAYLKNVYFFHPSALDLWLYVEKGIDIAKYAYMPEDYYKAICYKQKNGSYPTKEQLNADPDAFESVQAALNEYREMHEPELLGKLDHLPSYGEGNAYMVHESDYIAFTKQVGETHSSATKDPITLYNETPVYFLVHSSDPAKTEAWLRAEFADAATASDTSNALITPDLVFASIIREKAREIITSLITMAVLIVLMSICMYFIMRSSLLNRIKEVGIYRAIGVSKKNLIFKFFVEAAVLSALTVLVGYLLTSGFLIACLGMSSLVSEIFYYPLWLACAVLLLLLLLSLFFGTLPVIALLRKTPSEILAKYDI